MENLVAQLTRLPGIGTRTAQRLAFHLLSAPKPEALALSDAIAEVKRSTVFTTHHEYLSIDKAVDANDLAIPPDFKEKK